MHYLSGIRYNYVNGSWVVRQHVSTLSLYSLEGDFEKAAKHLLSEKESLYESYVQSASDLSAHYFLDPNPKSHYGAGYTKLKVQFDKLELEWGEEDGEKTLRVWGTRGPTEKEFKALETDRLRREQESKDRELADYERLKKKFEGGND